MGYTYYQGRTDADLITALVQLGISGGCGNREHIIRALAFARAVTGTPIGIFGALQVFRDIDVSGMTALKARNTIIEHLACNQTCLDYKTIKKELQKFFCMGTKSKDSDSESSEEEREDPVYKDLPKLVKLQPNPSPFGSQEDSGSVEPQEFPTDYWKDRVASLERLLSHAQYEKELLEQGKLALLEEVRTNVSAILTDLPSELILKYGNKVRKLQKRNKDLSESNEAFFEQRLAAEREVSVKIEEIKELSERNNTLFEQRVCNEREVAAKIETIKTLQENQKDNLAEIVRAHSEIKTLGVNLGESHAQITTLEVELQTLSEVAAKELIQSPELQPELFGVQTPYDQAERFGIRWPTTTVRGLNSRIKYYEMLDLYSTSELLEMLRVMNPDAIPETDDLERDMIKASLTVVYCSTLPE